MLKEGDRIILKKCFYDDMPCNPKKCFERDDHCWCSITRRFKSSKNLPETTTGIVVSANRDYGYIRVRYDHRRGITRVGNNNFDKYYAADQMYDYIERMKCAKKPKA